jgi:protein-tyrosine-phosphatase
MVEVGVAKGLDLTPHRAQGLESADPPDLVLCMEQHHVDAAVRAFPNLPHDTIRLLVDTGIADPYGRPMAAYERSASSITTGIEGVRLPEVH